MSATLRSYRELLSENMEILCPTESVGVEGRSSVFLLMELHGFYFPQPHPLTGGLPHPIPLQDHSQDPLLLGEKPHRGAEEKYHFGGAKNGSY
jgi:hypothetical protein